MLICAPLINITDTETLIQCTCGHKIMTPRPHQALNRLISHFEECPLLIAYKVYRSLESWPKVGSTNEDTGPAARTNDSPVTISTSPPSTAP